MIFLLQKEFQNEAYVTLQRAQDFHAWKNDGKETFEIYHVDNEFRNCLGYKIEHPEIYCPVGSVQFCHNFYKQFFGIDLKPINVPSELFSFAGRKVENLNLPLEDDTYVGSCFVKSNDIEKYSQNGWYDLTALQGFQPGNYQISELIEIESEWRCFIHEGELLSPHFYQGDPWIFPDMLRVQNMIEAYSNHPTSYTIDVAIHFGKNGNLTTSILEVHDFYACGLYGFQDLDKLPFMYWRSHLDKINKYGNRNRK